MKSKNKILGAGILSAIAASLCCITPVLAIIAGASGLASSFSWIEPARPYFIGLTIIILGIAWYQQLKPRKQADCNCESGEKPKFLQSKGFLPIVTIFAGLMLTFPMYAGIFYPQSEKQAIIAEKSDIETVDFNIEGMTCSDCERPIKYQIDQLPGIIESTVSYAHGNAIVEFDKSKTSIAEIETAINSTGYIVIGKR